MQRKEDEYESYSMGNWKRARRFFDEFDTQNMTIRGFVESNPSKTTYMSKPIYKLCHITNILLINYMRKQKIEH